MNIQLNIGEKLALILILFSLLVTVFLTASYYLQFEKALRERVFLQLSSVKQLKKVKILNDLRDHLATFNQLKYDSLQRPSSDFIEMVRDTVVPQQIKGYNITTSLNVSDSVKVIDVTSQNVEAGITVIFISQVKDQVFTALVRLSDVQDILLERTGLGETGESYLVNSDRQLISKSRFDSINWKKTTVQTRGVNRAFNGNPGTDIFMDYRNIRVLGAFEKIEFMDMQWVLLSEINFNEAMAPIANLRDNLLYIFILIFIFILIVSYYLSRLVVKPVVIMEKRLIQLSEGILEDKTVMVERPDEIGLMFNALNKLIEGLKQTVVFAGQIGSGNFDAEYKPLSTADKLGHALLQMKQQLQEYKINEFRLMRENQISIIEGQEKERSRLSKDLHDGIGPLLTTLKMHVQAANLDKKVKTKLIDQLDGTINEIRIISNNLMPSVLEDFGVGEAINNLVKQLAGSNALTIKYKNDMKAESLLEKSLQINLYRVVQEAISNSVRHSGCTEIKVSLSEFDEYVGLFVADNGKGFDVKARFSGNGVRNMKERVKLLNGSIDIASDKSGTTIEIEIPLK